MRIREYEPSQQDSSRSVRPVQRKLEVGRADDPLEVEADRTADAVMKRLTLPAPTEDERPPTRRLIRRSPDQIGAEGGPIDRTTEQQISSSSGQPLRSETREPMESAFGADFSSVRVHVGPRSDSLNEHLSSTAFTAGSDVFIRSGAYRPNTESGRRLLAHELTHVVQQRGTPPPGPSKLHEGKSQGTGSMRRRLQSVRVIRRRIPTDKEWSSLAGTTGTVEFTKITLALNEYNSRAYAADDTGILKAGAGTQELKPEERIAKVDAILAAIDEWKTVKAAKYKSKGKQGSDDEVLTKSKRWKGVTLLETEAKAEKERLAALREMRRNPKTADDVMSAAQEIYSRGMHAAFRFVGLEPSDKSRAQVTGYWKSFRTEAAILDRKAVGLTKKKGDAAEANNADLLTLVIREAMRAFRTITYSHLNVEKAQRIDYITDPEEILLSVRSRISEVRAASNKAAVQKTMKAVLGNVEQLLVLSGAKRWAAGGQPDEPESDDQLHLDLIDSIFTALDETFTITGYLGTGGTGNEGFEEAWKTTDATTSQQNVAEAFTSGAPTSASGQARVSGSSDIISALAGLGGDVVSAYNAWQVYKDEKKSELERASAKVTLVATPISALSNVYKLEGGAMHMKEVLSGSSQQSEFLPKTDSATTATDIKMAGDVLGLASSVLGTITKFLDFLQSAQDAAEDPKAEARPLATYGLALRDDVALVTSLASNVKAAAKLAHQIGGDTTSAALATSQVFPALGLIVSVLDLVRSAQRIHRFRVRRNLLNQHIKTLGADPVPNVQKAQALELVNETLTKRLTRAGLDLSRSVLQVGAGIANLTGVGTAPGMVISLAATATQVGQFGVRTGKKAARESHAKKRQAKGKEEAYEHWKLRKHLETATSGPFVRLKTAINIKLTTNWDKIKGNKAAQTKTAALEILEMDEGVVYEALGARERLAAETDPAKRLKIVVEALEKR